MTSNSNLTCPKCRGRAALVTGAEVYPHRPDLHQKWFYACLPCQVWAGCHGDTKNQKGRLADAASRRLKIAAHEAFDPLWRTKRMTRPAAYAWLRKQLGLDERACHMGWMSDDDLRRVIAVSTEYRTKEKTTQ